MGKKEIPVMQAKTGNAKKKNKTSWKPGQSGNPSGGKKDPAKQEVLAIFKEAAPELLRIAIKRAIEGNNDLLKALVMKALPDDINVNLRRSAKEMTRDELITIASRGRRGSAEEGSGDGELDSVYPVH